MVGIVAAERIDPDYFNNLGVVLEYLPVLPIWEVTSFLRHFKNSMVVVDSLSAIQPDIESDENWNEHVFSLLKTVNDALRPGNSLVVVTHVRAKRSANPNLRFAGGTETAARRMTDQFSVQIELSRKDVSAPKYTQVVNIRKNILAPPAQYLELESYMGYGVHRLVELLKFAASIGVLTKKGSSFWLEDTTQGDICVGRGKDAAVKALATSQELEEEIIRRVIQTLGG